MSEVSITIEENSSLTRPLRGKSLTDEVRRELQEIFDLFMDMDTYRVSGRQLKEMMRVYGYHPKKEQLQRVLTACGVRRRDENMTYDTFEKIMEKLITERKAASGIIKAFELFDIHGDGCLTFTSLGEVARMMGDNFKDDDILEMIVEADLDRDGVVDIRDFAAMMKLTDISW